MLPRPEQTTYLQGGEIESTTACPAVGLESSPHLSCCWAGALPAPAALWPRPPRDVLLWEETGSVCNLPFNPCKDTVPLRRILKNEVGPATFTGIRILCQSQCLWHKHLLLISSHSLPVTSCLESSEELMDETKM